MKSMSLVASVCVAGALLMGLVPQASTQPDATAVKAGAGTANGSVDPLALVLVSSYRMVAMPIDGGMPDDLLYVPVGIGTYLSPIDNIADFGVPDDASLIGFEVYAQVVYTDAAMFPADPVKTSQLLRVRLGNNDLGVPLTAGTGLDLKLANPALLGTVFQLVCTFVP